MRIAQSIERHLQLAFEPEVIEIVNESSMHNVPAGSESHFKVVIVSKKFQGKSPLERHQQVHLVLSEELTVIHALSMQLFTPDEWTKQTVLDSPVCRGANNK